MANELGTGSVVGHRYQLQKLLGEGGYGAVYQARDMVRNSEVAIKLMHSHMSNNEQGRKRFEREAETVRSLQHETIVALLDYGVDETDVPYIVFEMLHGRSLSEEILRCGALGQDRTVDITRQVLQALQLAHGHQVVHRDIKPANIFLCGQPGEPDRVKVLDFGIAKPMGAERKTALTKTGQMLGTAQYMAPEQVRGEPVDATVDLYALGATVSEMLTGHKLVKGGTAIEVFILQVEDAPLTIPTQLDTSPLRPIIARAVAKPRAQRFNSATEMLDHINQALGLPSQPPSDTSWPEPQVSSAAGSFGTPSHAQQVSSGQISSGQIASGYASSAPYPSSPHASGQLASAPYPSSPHASGQLASAPYPSSPHASGQLPSGQLASTPYPSTPHPSGQPWSAEPGPPATQQFPPTGAGSAYAGPSGHPPGYPSGPSPSTWPQGHAGYPPMQSVPTTAAAGNRNLMWIAALAFCMLVIGALSVVVFMQSGERAGDDEDDGTRVTDTRPSKPRPSKPSPRPEPASEGPLEVQRLRVPSGSLAHLNNAIIERRLKATGAAVKVNSETNTPGVMQLKSFNLSGEIMGNVQLVRHANPQTAEEHFKALPDNQFTSARFDGSTMVIVMVFGGKSEYLCRKLVR